MSQTTPRSSRTPVARTSWVKDRAPWLYAFWKFSRPHTVIGTSLSAIGVYLIALAERFPGSSSIFVSLPPTALLSALIACLCGNIYIVGLNQLEDVEIDRINKPHLPLASQEFSHRQGVAIVAIAGILSLLISYLATPFLLATLVTSLVIGTLYSLPPVRLKRFPFWASLCILTVRGGIVNLGLYLHYTVARTGGVVRISPAVWALTVFIVVFTCAIALFKDIPDTEGDRRYNIATFTLQMGRRAVFDLCKGLMTLAYVGMMGAGLIGLPGVNSIVLVGSQGLALGLLWWGTTGVDLQDQRSIARTYQFIWKLFFLEYLLLPLACFPR